MQPVENPQEFSFAQRLVHVDLEDEIRNETIIRTISILCAVLVLLHPSNPIP